MRKSLAPSQNNNSYSPATSKNREFIAAKEINLSASENAKKFKVYYGNFTRSKHKVYDFEGFVEIEGSRAMLKDANGKVFDEY